MFLENKEAIVIEKTTNFSFILTSGTLVAQSLPYIEFWSFTNFFLTIKASVWLKAIR